MSRIENPTPSAVSGGFRRQCPNCPYRQFSINDTRAHGVHICADKQVVHWEGGEVHGQKTTPPSAGYLAVLAKKATLKDKRR